MAGSFFDTTDTFNNGSNNVFNPATAGKNGAGGIGAGKWRNMYKDWQSQTTDPLELNNMKFSDTTFRAMDAMKEGKDPMSIYMSDIKDLEKKGDFQGLKDYLTNLVQIINDKPSVSDTSLPNCVILSVDEPAPDKADGYRQSIGQKFKNVFRGPLATFTSDPISQYYPAKPSHDDKKNGFWVAVKKEYSNSAEYQAINLITRGGRIPLTAGIFGSKFKKTHNTARKQQEELLNNIGITQQTLSDTIRYNQSIMTGQHSKAEQYDSLGKAMAQLEVLKDQGSDYADKYEQAINSQLNALRKTDPYVDYYTKVFMSDYYLQYTSNYPQWMKENNPEIAAKINKAEQLKNDRSVHFAMLRLRTKSRSDIDNSRDINAVREMAYGSQEA